MLYGQIITFLFVLLILYYVGMIVMDLHKAKKMKELEADKVSENDIDYQTKQRTSKRFSSPGRNHSVLWQTAKLQLVKSRHGYPRNPP